MKPIGVIFMAYGGPKNLSELPGYLADIRSGRPTPPAVLEEITHNYEQIGGRSPLLDLTTRQMQAIAALLNADGKARFQCYLGMRHWAPWIEDTIRDMLDAGIERAVSVVMAPHFSQMSIAKYHERIANGLALYRGYIEFAHVKHYHTAPGLITALAERVRDGLSRWPENERGAVHVIFSAHSLPERIIKMGDPYDQQLHETAQLIANAVGLTDAQWSWSYQSAGRTPEPWLGPAYLDHLRAIHAQGVRNVVAVPVGFLADHVEILYDIDIQAQALARELGVRLERPPALNDHPLLMAAIADAVKAQAAPWLEEKE